jgi:hypothetical protein
MSINSQVWPFNTVAQEVFSLAIFEVSAVHDGGGLTRRSVNLPALSIVFNV